MSEAQIKVSEIELRKIDPETLGQIWNRIQPRMQSVYETSNGRMDAASTFALIHSGQMVMWCIYDEGTDEIYGLTGATIEQYETGVKALYLHFIVGKERKKWMHLLENIEEWGREMGCSKIEFMCRKGWQRELQDYNMTHMFLEKDL